MGGRTAAQVDFSPIFTTLRLEARADFDYLTVMDSTHTPDAYGFRGRYFNLHIGGNLGDKFSYYFRQRIVATPGTVNLFDNTDFLYMNYMPNKNWMFRLGKDALAVGGFEYDAPPIDVLFSTHYWDNFYCFQMSASGAFRSSDGNHMLLAQVGNSPYVYYGSFGAGNAGGEWRSGLLSYNLFWSGTFGHFKMLYSANLFEREPDVYMNYIAMGHKLTYDKWDIYLDFIHHALSTDDWGSNYAVVSCMNFLATPALNIFVKGAYEQNRSDYATLNIRGTVTDCLVAPQHAYLLYGAGFEYRPKSCQAVRIHGFMAGREISAYADANGNRLDSPSVENTLEFNLGITWNMDVHKMLSERLYKITN